MRHEHTAASRRFERLSRMRDFDVARTEVDPRGWAIVDAANHQVGEVRDLIVDTERMTGRYLDVELTPKVFSLRREDARILVPIERAHRVGDHRRLTIDGLTHESVTAMTAAREEHELSFWQRWWDTSAGTRGPGWSRPADERATTSADLQRALQDVPPGETVRIPVVNEEVIVERRPIHPDDVPPPSPSSPPWPRNEHAVARDRETDAPPRRRDGDPNDPRLRDE